MSTENEGPLAKLNRMLGLSDLAPIAAVKRIDERPVSLNPEAFFKMTPSPMQKTPAEINQLYDGGPVSPTTFDPIRRRMAYDRIPIGHDVGYRCYDAGKHSADSAFEAGEFGDGLSENEAYADWLRNIDEPEGPSTSAERELDEAIDDGITFDDDLE